MKKKKRYSGQIKKNSKREKSERMLLFLTVVVVVLFFMALELGFRCIFASERNQNNIGKAENNDYSKVVASENNNSSDAEYAVAVPFEGIDTVTSANDNTTDSNLSNEQDGTSFSYPSGGCVITENIYNNDYSVKLPDGQDTITVSFAGDVLFSNDYAVMSNIRRNGGSIEGVMDANLLDLMKNSDLCMVNNEFPYTLEGSPNPGKEWTFHASPDTVAYLYGMGVDFVTLGNNHVFDYGEVGMNNTFTTLKNAKIPYIGAGENIDEASRILYFTTSNGIKLAFINGCDIEKGDNPFTRGATQTQGGVFRTRDDSLLCSKISQAKSNGAFVIVYMHWGVEQTTQLNHIQQSQSVDIARAGADLIVGDHPHCLQKVDYVEGVPIIYSLGNFLFNSKTVDTGLLQATFSTQGVVSWKFVPAIQRKSSCKLATGAEKMRILNYLQSLSSKVIIDADGNISSR